MHYGKYRAFVRDNNDPERLGRVRLEIPSILGMGRDHWSDWASPCFPYGGSDDAGMFFVPQEGASVWVEFENGDAQYPIWVGTWPALSNPGEQPNETKRLCHDPTCLDCEDKLEHKAHPWDDIEHKKYHHHPPYYCPRRTVLIKTETGHTIAFDDRDQEEYLKIIDRGGQALQMTSPVKRPLQVGNSKRRQERDAIRGDQLSIQSDIHQQKAEVQLIDLARQSIRLEAWHDREKVHITSNDATRARFQKVLLDTTKDREKLTLFGLNGTQSITIDGTKGRERITIRDKAGSTFTMDGLTGNIVMKPTNMLIMG